jgi:hypothetical protein
MGMLKRSHETWWGGYQLIVNEDTPNPTPGENWTVRVVAPSGQPIGNLDYLTNPHDEAVAKQRAEWVARDHAKLNGKTLPDSAPEWY